MSIPVPSAFPHHAACKVCSTPSPRFSVVDFAKTCSHTPWEKQDPLGIPVMYYRCPACELIFTTFFDTWTNSDFASHIYNDTYLALDPDYIETRPRGIADLVHQTFPLKSLRLLDYGGGNGAAEAFLREKGYTTVTTFEPFNPKFAARPSGQFDLILCIEVMEHMVQPRELARDLLSLLADDGVILLSTLLQDQTIPLEKGEHWYIAPRNGHTHFHSQSSVERCFANEGYTVSHANQNLHLVYKNVPVWAGRLFRSRLV